MNVKICGLTRPEDAALAIEHGADALGFIFYPKSKRFIEPARVAEFSQDFPVPRVGVSVNAEVAEYESWIQQNAVDVLQLHGEEPPQKVAQASSLWTNYPRRVALDLSLKSYNPHQPISSHERNLPHWEQSGATYAVTFRLADSIPRHRLDELASLNLPESYQARLNEWLDQHEGQCVLRNPGNADILKETLLHFHGKRYWIHAAVIMPNHVHVLLTPLDGHNLSEILHSWKSFSSNQINQQIGSKGKLWQNESFDHLIRDRADFLRQLKYIRENPKTACLREGEFVLVDQVHASFGGFVHRLEACATLKVLALPPKPGQLNWSDYPDASAFLLDANVPEYGGSGHTVDWSLAAAFVRECDRPVILSGGLTPENVAQAINQVHPWGVDVSSGVESSPGIKDPAKLRDFLQICKAL